MVLSCSSWVSLRQATRRRSSLTATASTPPLAAGTCWISLSEISRTDINGGVEAVAVSEERRRVACLSDTQLEQLSTIARQVERHYGRAQDIEWAIDRHSGAILLLQSRPETVWSARDAAPIAKPQQDPLM